MTLIGTGVRRKEDLRLLRGQGDYADDIHLPDATWAVFARAPYAHARLVSIDVSAAREMPGVVAVLTGADLQAAGIGAIPHVVGSSLTGADIALKNRDGSERARTDHPPLILDRSRFAGEPFAAVIADSVAAAKDAAELIEAEWEELPAVTSALAALEDGAPQLWDHVPGNLALEAEIGDEAATDAALAGAAHRVVFDSQINRVTGVHMEPRSSAAWVEEDGRVTVRCSGGTGVVQMRESIAQTLGLPVERVRIVAPGDVGGNFGTRNATYPEFVVIAHAARQTGRPVKHLVERSEAFSTDYQARDLHVRVELGMDEDGTFLALKAVNTSNIGAHTASYVPLNKGIQLMTGLYRVPVAHATARAVLTNTPPTIPYRSAGRPEAMYAIERLVDLAARECGFDPIELRRRNMIPREAFPYTNPFGITYDSGDHIAAMDRALELADHAGLPARREKARARGKRLGFGFANYIEGTGGIPRERAEVTVIPGERRVEVVLGTQDTGQGHRTAFAQLVADWLGLEVDEVTIRTGDTDVVLAGGGSHSGRSLRFGSIVMDEASRGVIARARAVFAALNGAEAGDVEFSDGYLRLADSNVVTHLFDLAGAAEASDDLPEDLRGPIAAVGDKVTAGLAFPYGAAVCELEIDPDTGAYEIVRYTSVDDVGRALNPMILHGQTHGGIAQGVGQALFEGYAFDEMGQNVTGSLMDYQLPRAGDFPMFTTDLSEVPATSHPMGFRPGGEGGTTPALATCTNAVADALAEYGVRHLEMPVTPLRIWQAIEESRG
ncbi:xanthine dehydrogenase family protein molybdopterin-binding subunit [Wenxinia marina]|uniref:Aerobic-type carbon monoxide dehydrogenase, large subunit CoxL/CutL-like protein n=1 Tax=Wenxinia marina DSM 24838 TaxID=1123501 RepID=A0A0D0Q167_9RHOB|nr:xanthine dehydrogenase family protein molybdopterin-binding subunit [Wenxinia marina]KIQ68309.1 Aerobic-type carbon monoxide dehydrogenase, large subunit CoxL/CutL-like protein [Wenxinia marina DSM 24838]GGL79643.1 carbon-monoxide dehydrogenase large subunit [Wenxinia marina]